VWWHVMEAPRLSVASRGPQRPLFSLAEQQLSRTPVPRRSFVDRFSPVGSPPEGENGSGGMSAAAAAAVASERGANKGPPPAQSSGAAMRAGSVAGDCRGR